MSPIRLWRPEYRDVATDTTALTVTGISSFWAVVAAVAGASVQSIISVSFAALTMLVCVDAAAGVLRVLVLDYRTYILTGMWKSNVTWTKAIRTPVKWIAYGLLTLGAAGVVLTMAEAAITVPSVWAIAFLHSLLCLVEFVSIASNLSIFPGVADTAGRFLRRVHPHAAELLTESVDAASDLVEHAKIEEAAERRRGRPPGNPTTRRTMTGTDN
jgi:hypothetical protein